jgi:hypothetical protein
MHIFLINYESGSSIAFFNDLISEAGGFFGLEELDDHASVLYYNTGDTKLLLEDEDPELLESDEDSEEDHKKNKKEPKNKNKKNKGHEEPTSDDIHEASVNTTDSAGFDGDESEDGLASSREVIDLHKQAIKNTMNKKNAENKKQDKSNEKQKESKKIEQKQTKKNEPQAKENNKNNKEAQSTNETKKNKPEQKKTKEDKKSDQKRKVKFEQPQEEDEIVNEEEENDEVNEEQDEVDNQEETANQEEQDPILLEEPEELRTSMADWTKLYPEMHIDILRGTYID